MRKYFVAGALLAVTLTAASAAGDPVATRKAIMQSVAANAGLAGAMMKGDIAYSPAAGKAAIASMNAAANALGAFYPDGTQNAEGSSASPKIWEDAAGFEAALAKFSEVTGAAAQASGKDGPADVEAFKTAMGPVMGSCKACHEAYRVQR
ncbi:c-type cytochrome [Pannonibacter phragmitetus]|uniref:Cytochrome C signal peptide protein n=1 Tax=Pannonibacter phragmitetus TaxID=121719 RepID=A0A0U3PD53_9HYPH|nr:cytochrome c [Pannonibacter phragmitetus]ALV29637.1 cytochrome C signal peptide protein [Pannonibacter phragmitetus]